MHSGVQYLIKIDRDRFLFIIAKNHLTEGEQSKGSAYNMPCYALI